MNPVQSRTHELATKSRQADDGPMITGGRDEDQPANRLPSKTACQTYHDFMTLREVKSTVDPDEEIPFKVDWLK